MTTNTTSAPILESWIARAGICGVAALSAYVGFSFWQSRGDDVLAWLTLACEAVALGGMAMVVHHSRQAWGKAVGGLIVTALAAGWCGMTMVEKLSSESHHRAVQAAQAGSVYAEAKADLGYAAQLYRAALAAQVPEGLGPKAADVRRAELAQRVAQLKAERDGAQQRLDTLTPSPSLDMLALARGAGIEIAKLIGLVVFGIGFSGQSAPVVQLKPGQVLANARWGKRAAPKAA